MLISVHPTLTAGFAALRGKLRQCCGALGLQVRGPGFHKQVQHSTAECLEGSVVGPVAQHPKRVAYCIGLGGLEWRHRLAGKLAAQQRNGGTAGLDGGDETGGHVVVTFDWWDESEKVKLTREVLCAQFVYIAQCPRQPAPNRGPARLPCGEFDNMFEQRVDDGQGSDSFALQTHDGAVQDSIG